MLRSEQWHVFEITRHLPRFSMYSVVPEIEASDNFVSFFISERVQRVRQRDSLSLIRTIIAEVLFFFLEINEIWK